MNKVCAVMLASVAGATLLLQATAAGAATTRHVPHQTTMNTAPNTRLASPRVLTAPKGYTIVNSAPFVATAGTQTFGFVTCPGTEQPAGGGAIVQSQGLALNINSSFPAENAWRVFVDNSTTQDFNFTVYEVCIAKSASYTVATTTADTVTDSTQSAAADCPAGTTVLGGGALAASFTTDVGINSSVPNQLGGNQTAWRAAISTGDSPSSTFTVYAICRAKPAGYSIQFGPSGVAAGFAQTIVSATCPGASLPIGGGGFTAFASTDTAIQMNSTLPEPNENGWAIAENNDSAIGRTLDAAVICAGT
jgi:hypothetical protein